MKISWNSPAADAVLSYDSGVAASQVGFMESVGTIVIGSVFRSPMTLNSLERSIAGERHGSVVHGCAVGRYHTAANLVDRPPPAPSGREPAIP